MARVYLYEDTGGSLYIHRHGDRCVYAHVEQFVSDGSDFDRDASSIDSGVRGDEFTELIPWDEFTEGAGEPSMKRIAVWEDGKIEVVSPPGSNGLAYLGANTRMHDLI